MNRNYFTLIHRAECEAVFIKFAFTIWFDDVYSRLWHWEAKWVILPQSEHLFPNAGQLFLAARCFPPQSLYLSTSLRTKSFASRSSFSRLSLAELSCLLLTDTLPRFVCSFNESNVLCSSKVLVRVFDNSAALQNAEVPLYSKVWNLKQFSRSCRSWIPQMIRFLNSESSRSPKLQVVANSFFNL